MRGTHGQAIFPMLFSKMVTAKKHKNDQSQPWKSEKEGCTQQDDRQIQ